MIKWLDCIQTVYENQLTEQDVIIIIFALPGYSERTRLQLPYYQLFEDQIYFFYRKLRIHQVQSFQGDKDMVSQVSEKNVHHSSKMTVLLSLMENGQLPVNLINTMIKISNHANSIFILHFSYQTKQLHFHTWRHITSASWRAISSNILNRRVFQSSADLGQRTKLSFFVPRAAKYFCIFGLIKDWISC